MIPLLLWFGEFALETSGAFFAFRRRLNILAAYLAFSAASDAILFLIRNQHPAYGYGAWIQEAVQYLILCALACQIVSRMLEDYRKLTGLACGLCALLGVVVGFVWNRGETWESRFLDAEISASMFLGAMIVLGWIGKKKELEGTWKLIGIGLLTITCGNSACAALTQYWSGASQLYPIPALASLLAWNLAALRNQRKEIKVNDATHDKRDLPHRIFTGPCWHGNNPCRICARNVEEIDLGKKPVDSVKIAMQGRTWVN